MRSRKESGFSLIEVMITSFILAVGLLGIVALQGIAKKSITDTDKQIEAAFHARTAMEELRADTRWVETPAAPADDAMIIKILETITLSASRSNLSMCHYAGGGDQMITIAVSWQIRNKPATAPREPVDELCGTNVDNRRQVTFSSMILKGV